MAIDSGAAALIVAGLTFAGVVWDKVVQRINSRESNTVSGMTAKSNAAKTEADVQINWMHEANKLQEDLMKLRRDTNEEIGQMSRRLSFLQEAHDKKDGLLALCQEQKASALGVAKQAIRGWEVWRLAGRAAWTYIDYLERGKAEPEYERLAKTFYLEATDYEKQAQLDDLARQQALEQAACDETPKESS